MTMNLDHNLPSCNGVDDEGDSFKKRWFIWERLKKIAGLKKKQKVTFHGRNGDLITYLFFQTRNPN